MGVHRLTPLIGLALAASLLSLPASARGGPQPLSFDGAQSFDQYVPTIWQQIDVSPRPTNPFGSACKWSVDDQHWTLANGNLGAGESATETKCVVSDHASAAPYGFSSAYVVAKSADVRLAVCFSTEGRCFAAEPVYDKALRAYRSTVCVRAHYRPDDPLLVEIAGSGGGLGVVTTVTTTVTNTGTRTVRDITAQAGYASDLSMFNGWQSANGCPGPPMPYVDHFEYPFEWSTS